MITLKHVKTTQIIRNLFEDRFITSLLMQINKERHENNPFRLHYYIPISRSINQQIKLTNECLKKLIDEAIMLIII